MYNRAAFLLLSAGLAILIPSFAAYCILKMDLDESKRQIDHARTARLAHAYNEPLYFQGRYVRAAEKAAEDASATAERSVAQPRVLFTQLMTAGAVVALIGIAMLRLRKPEDRPQKTMQM